MNAGIADATNLAWLLAAHLEGWAGDAILDAYEAERLPITEQVSRFAMDHAQAMFEAAPRRAGERSRSRGLKARPIRKQVRAGRPMTSTCSNIAAQD